MNNDDALAGALVADAAAMGLHWMYDQEQIKTISGSGDVLFRQPDAANFKDKRGYFAHAARRVGELSHYCLLYTSPSPRDKRQSRMPSSA